MPVSLAWGAELPSWSSDLDDLAERAEMADRDRQTLDLKPGWASRWTVRAKSGSEVTDFPCTGLADRVWEGTRPVREFGWHRRQRHRPGLQYLQSTGRQHGFESLTEQRFLLVADFLGVVGMMSQPFELRFTTESCWVRHIPDFLMVRADGRWLIDVRPAGQVAFGDRVKFAAAAEAALLAGWRYTVVTGWRPSVLACVDALSAQRRPMTDPLCLQQQLLRYAADGPVLFGELVSATTLPIVARAHALHLLWCRELGLDLSVVLSDRSAIWPTRQRPV